MAEAPAKSCYRPEGVAGDLGGPISDTMRDRLKSLSAPGLRRP